MIPAARIALADGRLLDVRGRRLGADDLDAVFALHQRAIAGTPPDLVARETRAFFAAHVAECGGLYGLECAHGLLACAVLGLPRPGDPNFGADHGLPPAQLARVAHLDGVSVDPAWRGRGGQRLLTEWRLAEAARAGRDIVLSTVAPGNPYSLDNLLAAGLTIRALRPRFGGWRYLMRRDLGEAPAPQAARWLPAGDLAAQSALLDAGWRGCAVRGGVCRELGFAPPAPSALA